MSHPRNQHIVPEFLLKNFSSDGLQIWSFDKSAIDKRWPEIKLRSISTVPTREHFYDKSAGSESESLEYKLRDIENKASSIIADLLTNQNLAGLDAEGKEAISRFLVTQSFRTIGGLDDVHYVHDQLKNFMEPHSIDFSSVDPKETWLQVIENFEGFIKHFMNKSWNLVISEGDFYLSDNPLTRYNSIKRRHRGYLGFDSKGIELYLPLSSSAILSLSCKETFPVENRTLHTQAENIEFMNWLQVKYSDRFIFSGKNNFDLIQDMSFKNEL